MRNVLRGEQIRLTAWTQYREQLPTDKTEASQAAFDFWARWRLAKGFTGIQVDGDLKHLTVDSYHARVAIRASSDSPHGQDPQSRAACVRIPRACNRTDLCLSRAASEGRGHSHASAACDHVWPVASPRSTGSMKEAISTAARSTVL